MQFWDSPLSKHNLCNGEACDVGNTNPSLDSIKRRDTSLYRATLLIKVIDEPRKSKVASL